MAAANHPDYGTNLRRLMARLNLTQQEVVERTGLDERTVKGILSGNNAKPHARTLHRLAAGLEVPVEELFQNSATISQSLFDRQTNPVVDDVIRNQPDLFVNWSDADFNELYSRIGSDGTLTEEGVLMSVAAMKEKQELLRKVEVLLESGEGDLLTNFVDLLFQRIRVDN